MQTSLQGVELRLVCYFYSFLYHRYSIHYTESLGETAYQNNPRFVKFVKDNNLSFKAYTTFGKKEIAERAILVAEIMNIIWNIETFS